MKNRKIIFLIISLLSTAIIVLFLFGIEFVVELWWFESLGYTTYFALREGYRDIIALIVTLLSTVIFYINFSLVSRFSDTEQDLKNLGEDTGLTTGTFKSLFNKYHLVLALILSVPVLIPVYPNWETVLLFLFSNQSGVVDPAYGKDISFYFFSYPVYQLIQNELLLVCFLLIIFVSAFYWFSYIKQKPEMRVFPKPAKVHLTLLITVAVLLQIWSIALERIDLLYENRHTPVFFGPGAVEMRFDLPLIWMTFFAFLAMAISVIYYLHKQRGEKRIVVFLIIYLVLLGSREINFIPELLDDYYVKPNPVNAESRYMQFNIDATLKAFDLDQVRKIEFPANSTLTSEISTKISETLYNIPLWQSQLLTEVYEQLQEIRPYYDFSAIATDRYLLDGRYHQVNIAVRELSMKKLPAETNSWENRHLTYTHGYGTVVTPSSQPADQSKQWFVQNLSQTTEYEALKITQPEIYYGTGDYEYAIVPNITPSSLAKVKELSPDYQGNGGLKISSLFRKLVLAIFLKEQNLIFSRSLSKKSRLLMRRNINERIHAIAPFLQLEPNPVPAIINNKIYWIVDAYTTTDRYPLVEPIPSPFDNQPVTHDSVANYNYIRNSVKIIVDAYNGSVDFYIVDNTDPIVSAYRQAYPSLFKAASEIPAEFVNHLSYPETLFNQQMKIYSRYHDTNPSVFYQQNKRLEIPKIDNQPVPLIYLTLNTIESKNQLPSDSNKFVLLSMLSPYNRENLSMITIAGCLLTENCDKEYSGDIFAYQFPNDLQIEGPTQITALFDQTPEISEQFTLWGQRGSKVIKGHIIIVPFEEHILYVQPIYVAATRETGFPQLARVIVAMNQHAVMDTSLELAYKKLQQKLLTNKN